MQNEPKLERKGSTGSEKSLSCISAITAESKSHSKDIMELQKKMKVLREAVIRERQEKEELTKIKTSFADELDILRTQLQDKESQCLKLRNENIELNNSVQTYKKKAETLAQQTQIVETASHISGVFSGLFGGAKKAQSEEHQKLLTEYNYLRKQLEVVLEKLNRAESSIENLKEEHKHQIENLEKKIDERDKELEDKVQAFIALGHRNQELLASNELLSEEKHKLEEHLKTITEEVELAIMERDGLVSTNDEKMKALNQLNETCHNMEQEIETLTNRTGQLIAELEECELKLQVFDLKKTGKLVDTPAQILFRRTIAGEYVIEIENGGDRVTVYPKAIQSFGPHDETADEFYLEYKVLNGRIQKDNFIADEREKILGYLMTIVRIDQDSRKASGSKKNVLADKNLFSQMVSFFGS